MQKRRLQSWMRNTMEQYKVKLLPRAFQDLDSIYSYIAIEKQSPANAKCQTDRIKNAVMNLAFFPQSHQIRQEGRYANQGYRQLLVDNYLIIFRIHEEEKTVYVVTVQYQGRNI